MRPYPISREFAPYDRFTPLIRSAGMAGRMGALMKPPGWLWKDPDLRVRRETVPGYREEPVEVLVLEPRAGAAENCLVYFHGGGFFFEGAGYHYLNAKRYVLETPCKLLFVQYHLAPRHPFPWPTEDCYRALLWAWDRAGTLGVRRDRIILGGDSAGGCLAAAVAQLCRDRGTEVTTWGQLLIYPFLDRRLDSPSNLEFTDTPMWNSRLSRLMLAGYLPDPDVENVVYASPMEGSCADLPPAYIETAEFDSLRDDGLRYAAKLRAAGVAVRLNETRGTMHGFDIAQKAPTTHAALDARIAWLRQRFKEA